MTLAVRRWSGVAVLASLALAAAAWAAPAPSSTEPKKSDSPAEKINKALDQVADFALENSNLQAALNHISEQAKVNFVIDRFTITNQFGIDPNNSPINLKLTAVKTRTALRSVLNQYNLGYAIIGDTVLITSEDMATHRQLKQRVSIDLDKVAAAAAFKQLSKETGTNLLVDARVSKEAQGSVTLQVDDVPLDTAVRLVSEMAGLKVVRIGNVLFITNKATAQEMRQDPDLQGQPPGQTPAYGELQDQLKQAMQLQFQLQAPVPAPLLVNPAPAQPAQPAPQAPMPPR
jgi:hypothetical protein